MVLLPKRAVLGPARGGTIPSQYQFNPSLMDRRMLRGMPDCEVDEANRGWGGSPKGWVKHESD